MSILLLQWLPPPSLPFVVSAKSKQRKDADDISCITAKTKSFQPGAFTLEVTVLEAYCKPHPQASQCFGLQQRQAKRESWTWKYFHLINDFGTLKDNPDYQALDWNDKVKSPMWANCNVCGAILLAKPKNKSWSGGSTRLLVLIPILRRELLMVQSSHSCLLQRLKVCLHFRTLPRRNHISWILFVDGLLIMMFL